MLLKELNEGQRFEFSDKLTLVLLEHFLLGHPATGAFKYLGNTRNACPVLKCETTGIVITAVSKTYQRDVLVLLV